MTVINTIRTAMKQRAAFSRIKYEIETMPLETAIDLGLFREDAGKIAAKAIYG